MSSLTPDMDTGDVQETMVTREAVAPNVPNLLKVSPMDTTTATDVETSILDPAVQSDTFCRFVFLNKGILHSHSKIALSLTAPDDALKVGTKTLQEIDGYNFLSAYKSQFINNEHQKQREQVQSGRCIAHEFRYSDTTAGNGGPTNDTSATTYGLCNGREYNSASHSASKVSASFESVTPDLTIHEWANIKNGPVFQIALSELFPMLKQTQLPLFMMEEQVSVELHFDLDNVNRCQVRKSGAQATYSINQTETNRRLYLLSAGNDGSISFGESSYYNESF